MKSQEEIKSYIEALETQGVPPNCIIPPIYRLFWRLGINLAPPFNQPLHKIVLLGSGLFGVLTCLMVALGVFTGLISSHTAQQETLWVAWVSAGIIFGFRDAYVIKKKARSLTIPHW